MVVNLVIVAPALRRATGGLPTDTNGIVASARAQGRAVTAAEVFQDTLQVNDAAQRQRAARFMDALFTGLQRVDLLSAPRLRALLPLLHQCMRPTMC